MRTDLLKKVIKTLKKELQRYFKDTVVKIKENNKEQ